MWQPTNALGGKNLKNYNKKGSYGNIVSCSRKLLKKIEKNPTGSFHIHLAVQNTFLPNFNDKWLKNQKMSKIQVYGDRYDLKGL